ncbi:MAG: DUF817 domain-containing protein [Blastocatellia bacterium]|mgnify:CR=1 FL=1|nr:DUF817 domain-containing protein [Blastocatellia bacterium]
MLQTVDSFLLETKASPNLKGLYRFLLEFFFFGLKQARACLFAGLFFLGVFLIPRSGLFGIPRYDVLLIVALLIQVFMIKLKFETLDEVKAITLFHIVGFVLEVFKTSSSIASWSYPDEGYTKVFGVPIFSGFMYAAVGSYIIQAWRLFDLRIKHHPPYWMAMIAALLIYANFFAHHFIGDYRWYIAATLLGLYARSYVIYKPYDQDRTMPLLLSFLLIGFFLWFAENISTFFGIWCYPNQVINWSSVHIGKWSSWSLLVVMTFTIVVSLKHVKATIYVPE